MRAATLPATRAQRHSMVQILAAIEEAVGRSSTCGVEMAAELAREAASEDTPSWLPSRIADAPVPECCEAPGELWPCSAANAWSARSAPAH